MQLHAMHFPLYEPVNSDQDFANNGNLVSIISIVTRLRL